MKPNRLSTKKHTLRFAVIFRFLYREHGQHL